MALYEPELEPLVRSRAGIEASVERGVARCKLSRGEAETLLGRISWTTDLDEATENADVVIEAIIEDPRVKGEVFRTLDARVAPGALLASNTSSIPIAELASWTEHADRVLGLHFFSPGARDEARRGRRRAGHRRRDASRAPRRSRRRSARQPIRTKDRSGFIVNMLLVPYLMAAVRMYEEGFASREDIDEGMKLGADTRWAR